jgi:hypothetical protein
MKTDAPAIAKAEFIRVRKGGERIPVFVEIAEPRKDAHGVWCTRVALHGIDGRLSDICGEDSLQSLCLALQMVRARLAEVVAGGDRLVDSDGGAFPIEAYFPTR